MEAAALQGSYKVLWKVLCISRPIWIFSGMLWIFTIGTSVKTIIHAQVVFEILCGFQAILFQMS